MTNTADRCARCGRVIKNPASVEHGMGPTCYRKRVASITPTAETKRAVAETLELLNRFKAVDVLAAAERAGIVLGAVGPNDVLCLRLADGTAWTNIQQVVVEHSPTGLEWGYMGSGPADLALNILVRYINEATARMIHQDFKADMVAAIPEAGGVITDHQVREWIKKSLAPVPNTELSNFGERFLS